MSIRLLKPKIVNIVDKLRGKKTPSLLGYSESNYGIERNAAAFGGAVTRIFSDHEIKLLLLWEVISPSAGLAYLIWVKYPEFRILAVLLFAVSIFQFFGQWGGAYWLLQRMGVVPT